MPVSRPIKDTHLQLIISSACRPPLDQLNAGKRCKKRCDATRLQSSRVCKVSLPCGDSLTGEVAGHAMAGENGIYTKLSTRISNARLIWIGLALWVIACSAYLLAGRAAQSTSHMPAAQKMSEAPFSSAFERFSLRVGPATLTMPHYSVRCLGQR